MTQRTVLPDRTRGDRAPGSRPSRRGLAAVCGPMCLAATAGALGLAGGAIDLGDAVTSRLPAASPVLAGAALGLVVAVPMGAATVAGRRRSPWTADVAILAGVALVGWIAVELAVVRTFSWLQPACASYGAVVLALGLLLRRSDPGALHLIPARRPRRNP